MKLPEALLIALAGTAACDAPPAHASPALIPELTSTTPAPRPAEPPSAQLIPELTEVHEVALPVRPVEPPPQLETTEPITPDYCPPCGMG